jgi:addiction module HigA family antidote
MRPESTQSIKSTPPVHPGEILSGEFLLPLAISQNALGRALHVPPGRVNEIIAGKRRLTADTALRPARFFGTTPEFWMNLQNRHDLSLARDSQGEAILRDVIPLAQTKPGGGRSRSGE